MDQIDRDGDAGDTRRELLRPPQHAYLSPLSPDSGARSSPPPPARRAPRREPSIRLRRLPSGSSVNQQSTRISSPPLESSTSRTAGDRPQDGPAARPTDITEEDQGPSTRRRSSSEPRRGRFSAPPAIMLTRLTSRESEYPMSPVSEESPSQLRSSSDLPSHERNLLLVTSLSGDQEGEPKEPTLRSSIRRQLLDSVSTGRRNRASTVSVSTPVQRRLASDEYDSHIVDLLDVVGEFCSSYRCPGRVPTDGPSRPGSINTLHTHKRAKLSFRARPWQFAESDADIHSVTSRTRVV